MPVYDRLYNTGKCAQFDSKWEARIVYLTPSLLFCLLPLHLAAVRNMDGQTRHGENAAARYKTPIMLPTAADLRFPLTHYDCILRSPSPLRSWSSSCYVALMTLQSSRLSSRAFPRRTESWHFLTFSQLITVQIIKHVLVCNKWRRKPSVS